MAEALEAQCKRDLSSAKRLPNDTAASDSLAETEDQSQMAIKRRLNNLVTKAKNKAQILNAEEGIFTLDPKVAMELAKKSGWRWLNNTLEGSVYLSFLTPFIRTVQFIAGNLLHSEAIPALDIPDVVRWIIGLFIYAAIFLAIMLGISLLVQVFEDPLQLVEDLGSIFWKLFWDAIISK